VCLMIIFDRSRNPLPISCSLHVHQNRAHYRPRSISRIVWNSVIRDMRAGPEHVVLLRKEVIQPHLPVRLPCYDFVPIADPTFDGSLPEGLGHRLRVLPTFMT
jgi:hypothetical protein